MSDRPLLTVDLDGVICRPPLGVNLGISRDLLDPNAAPSRAYVPPRWLAAPLDYVRFGIRWPLPEARDALAALSELRRVVIVSGRRSSPEGWLRRHGLEGFVDRVVFNDTADASPHFKLRSLRELGASEHVDDDGRTAQLLAQLGIERVYLRDWPRNRGPSYAPNVVRVANLLELARRMASDASPGAPTD